MAKRFNIALVVQLEPIKKFGQLSYGALNLETSFIDYSILMEKGINAAANDDDQVDITKYTVGVQWEPAKKCFTQINIVLASSWSQSKRMIEFFVGTLDLETSSIAYSILMEKGINTAANHDDHVDKTIQMESM